MQTNPFKVGDKVRQKYTPGATTKDGIKLHFEKCLQNEIFVVEDVSQDFVYIDENSPYFWERFELVSEEKVQEKIPTLKEKSWWGIVDDENQILDLYKTRKNARESKTYWPDSTKIKKIKLTVME